MVRCERAALVLFLRYIRDRIVDRCMGSKDILKCVVNEIELIKDDIETRSIPEIEKELYG